MNKVIGIGLPKTATSSLAETLNRNGVPTIHFGNIECEEIWQKLPMGIYKYDVMDNYVGITNAFDSVFPQIDNIYPNSKFIYTIRDIDSWLESVKTHWSKMMKNPKAKPMEMYHHLITYGSFLYNEDRFRFVYMNHERMVKEYFMNRQSDLLTINIIEDKMYVTKVCDFLNIPILDDGPVHLNKGKDK